VGLLLLFLGVGISLFATTVYALEHHLPGTTFTSVPVAWWWATTSMTTVGYGDIRPESANGKVWILLYAFSCSLFRHSFQQTIYPKRLKIYSDTCH